MVKVPEKSWIIFLKKLTLELPVWAATVQESQRLKHLKQENTQQGGFLLSTQKLMMILKTCLI
jgi:hypothetical protein